VVIADTWYDIVLPPFVILAALCLGAVLLWLVRGKLAEFVGQLGVQKISAFGVDLQFVEQQTTKAYKKQKLAPPSQEDKAAVRDAVRLLAPLAAQKLILWVDDLPGNNVVERSTFLSWQVGVQTARTTDEGLRELEDKWQSFGLVISDWSRPSDDGDLPAGLQLLERMRELERPPRVIFYHGLVDAGELAQRRREANAAGAVGTTASPGELFRWTLLELARSALDSSNPTQREHREGVSSASGGEQAKS
jgi:CheY-like chemotaxis protein